MSRISDLAWLTSRPIAHRGLHERARGFVENTASAARAAVAADFAIECDLQLSSDGEAVVFHDFTLDRLTTAIGRLDALPVRQLAHIRLRDTDDQILALSAFLDVVAGRVPVICEIKSRFDGDTRLARRAAEIASAASGLIALKSFDPDVISWLRHEAGALGAAVPLGVVAMADYDGPAWAMLDAERKRSLAGFLHWEHTEPDFLSYCVDDLPHPVPYLCRAALGMPLMVWTVRARAQALLGRRWADQIIFEGQEAVSD